MNGALIVGTLLNQLSACRSCSRASYMLCQAYLIWRKSQHRPSTQFHQFNGTYNKECTRDYNAGISCELTAEVANKPPTQTSNDRSSDDPSPRGNWRTHSDCLEMSKPATSLHCRAPDTALHPRGSETYSINLSLVAACGVRDLGHLSLALKVQSQ